MKRIIALAMTLVLSIGMLSASVSVVANAAYEKISDALLVELDNATTTLACVEIADVDRGAVMEIFEERYPLEYQAYVQAKIGGLEELGHNTSIEVTDALLQRAIECKREIYKMVYAESNLSALSAHLSDVELVFVSTYAPIAILEVDEASTLSLALDSSIISLEVIENQETFTDEELMLSTSETSAVTESFIEGIELANSITRADYVRDTYGHTGEGVKIGIAEAAGVPDTSNPYLTAANITIREGDTTVDDHATRVTAILAAADANGSYGVVPDADFYCCHANNTLTFYSGVEWMLDCGVNVINASLGWYSRLGYYDPYSAWVDHIAVLHDVHFVAAAGNQQSNNPNSYITAPGMAYNAITVGNIDPQGSSNVEDFIFRYNSSYVEKDVIDVGQRPEKPNVVASGTMGGRSGTSYAAPQVTGVVAQLCCYDSFMKIRQSAVGAIIMASAAEKVNAVGTGAKGDIFQTTDQISPQISDKEGAGILDARWARGIILQGHYWTYSANASSFPITITTTVSATNGNVTRVAAFWLKRNTVDAHDGSLSASGPDLTNLDLLVYDPDGNLIDTSTTVYCNFEIIQFVPQKTGTYTIVVYGTTADKEHVGVALW